MDDLARMIWRKGFLPSFSLKELRVAKEGLASDDPAICQGQTYSPYSAFFKRSPVDRVCFLVYPSWKLGIVTLPEQVELFFNRLCALAEQRLKVDNSIAYFVNWYDKVPRERLISVLLSELKYNIEMRPHGRVKLDGGLVLAKAV